MTHSGLNELKSCQSWGETFFNSCLNVRPGVATEEGRHLGCIHAAASSNSHHPAYSRHLKYKFPP
jgi:hypothetical protein